MLKLMANGCEVNLINGDCIEELLNVAPNTVDLIAVDLPYGTTKNKWDIIIPFEGLWKGIKHVLKPEGTAVFTAAQPFTSQLILSNPKWFKYDLVWEKTVASGQLNVNKMQLRVHEYILVFYKKFSVYNEQKTKGEPYKIVRSGKYADGSYGKQSESIKDNEGFRHAKSVIKISNPRVKGGHPTQKPLELMEYIVKVYSNEGDTVLDCCMGNGTTGEACILNGRNFIGIELDETYYNNSITRLIED